MDPLQRLLLILSVMGAVGTFIGVVGTFIGIFIAWRFEHKRTKLEAYVQSSIDAISRSLVRIKQRSDWAKMHFDKILPATLKIPDEEKREKAAIHAKDGRSDANAIGDVHDIIQDQLDVLKTRGLSKPVNKEKTSPSGR